MKKLWNAHSQINCACRHVAVDLRMALSLVFLVLAEAFAAIAAPSSSRAEVIYVNASHPQASDQNLGAERLPLKTISRAADLARQNSKNGIGTRIVLYPGTYRESVNLEIGEGETDAPVVLEAKEKGKTIVSGSDVWSDWEQKGPPDIYVHVWPFRWGLARNPWQRDGINLNPAGLRREMIFLDGKLLEQVLAPQDLREGSFFVSEEEGLVYLHLAAGTDIRRATIEVSTRDSILKVSRKKAISIKGLVFQHANTPVGGGAAVMVADSSDIVIEDCQFIWNNWGGLILNTSRGVKARRNRANFNGASGIVTWKVTDIVMEESETSYNNWRGAKGGFFGWAVAGQKNMRTHKGTYRKHKAIGNRARGLWFDFDNSDIVIEDALLCNNLIAGLFIESSQGPIESRRLILCNNQRGSGLLAANSSNVTIKDSIIYGNSGSQIAISGPKAIREVTNWETGEVMQLKTERWTLEDTVIAAKSTGTFLLAMPVWAQDYFLAGLTSRGNVWYHPSKEAVFRLGQNNLTFSAWQSLSGQDLGSIFADPKFADPDNYQFTPLPGSPLRR